MDDQTRCAHYQSPLDVIAIKMACCETYYACKDCHEALADHRLRSWPDGSSATVAVLCGVCRHELTIAEYFNCGSMCPRCNAAFNPACRKHYHFYFSLR